MTKSVIKLMSLVMAVLFTMTIIAGCGSGTNNATDATTAAAGQTQAATTAKTDFEWEYMEDTSPVTIGMWNANIWPWAKPSAGWDNTETCKLVTQKTGVTLDIDVQTGKEEDLVGPLIASGDLPETMAFENYYSPYIQQMIDAGMVLPISDLIDQYAPKMWNLIPKETVNYHKSKDGKLYKSVAFVGDNESVEAYKSVNYPPTPGDRVMFIRSDILTAMGKEDIKTTDELYEALKFIKQKYPDVEPFGFSGDIGADGLGVLLSGSVSNYMPQVFGMHVSKLYSDNGNIKLPNKDPKYLDYMKFMNKLFKEGLITANGLTEKAQQSDEKEFGAKYGMFVGAVFHVYNTINTTIEKNTGSKDKIYKAVGPITAPGVEWKAPALRSWGGKTVIITKNCKEPERMIKLMEYLFTEEGQTNILLGVEGVTWDMVDGKRVMKPDVVKELSTSLEEATKKYGTISKWVPFAKVEYWAKYIDDYLVPAGPGRDELWKRLGPYVVDHWQEGFADLQMSIEVGSDTDIVYTKAKEAMTKAALKLVTAKSDDEFTATYDNSLKELDALGISKVEDALTAEFKKQLQILGK